MTFEPIDWDEAEDTAPETRRPRAGRRAVRRRYAILGVLAEAGGLQHVETIERALRRAPGTLYPDLAVLEKADRIKRVSGGSVGARTLYRIATPAERWQPGDTKTAPP